MEFFFYAPFIFLSFCLLWFTFICLRLWWTINIWRENWREKQKRNVLLVEKHSQFNHCPPKGNNANIYTVWTCIMMRMHFDRYSHITHTEFKLTLNFHASQGRPLPYLLHLNLLITFFCLRFKSICQLPIPIFPT